MKATDALKLRTIIREAYPYAKMDNEGGDAIWALLLKDYQFRQMYDALIEYIQGGNKYAPGVSELIAMSRTRAVVEMNEVVAYMDSKGYFDDENEDNSWNKIQRIRKTMMWIESERVPAWLKKDIEKYENELHPTRIGSEQKLLKEN